MKLKNIGIIGLVILSVVLVYSIRSDSEKAPEVSTQKVPDIRQPKPAANIPSQDIQDPEIPQKVYQLIRYIKQFNKAPPDHVGGRIFQNREKKLPATDSRGLKISYREWDVNAKKKGVNRGPERLITGSDESAFYTRDHYQSFIKIEL